MINVSTVVGDYINTMKTTFELYFDSYPAFKKNGYTKNRIFNMLIYT